jgi:hypothetical protein
MPKGKKGQLEAAYQYVKNKLPQIGFFSTLDELIAEAPFEKAPLEQWKNYLKPGRVFEREGVRFPLKQEEIEYGFGPLSNFENELNAHGLEPGATLDKKTFRELVQQARPDLSLQVGIPHSRDAMDYVLERFPEETRLAEPDFEKDIYEVRRAPRMKHYEYEDWAFPHRAENYEESVLRSTDFGPSPIHHFGPDSISHSRTTIQPLREFREPTDGGDPRGAARVQMRLIEEIQSDRHQKAAEKIPEDPVQRAFAVSLREQAETLPEGPEREALLRRVEAAFPVPTRRGYRTPQLEKELRDLQREVESGDVSKPGRVDLYARLNELKGMVPDAPFKDPADYGAFELRNQLLNAAKQGQEYLGLIRGENVSKRFSHGKEEKEGTAYVYDKVYRSQLEKLARQYGTTVKDVETDLRESLDVATPSMRSFDTETTGDYLDMQRGHLDDLLEQASETWQHGGRPVNPEDLKVGFRNLTSLINELKHVDPDTAESADQYVNELTKLYLDHKHGESPAWDKINPLWEGLWDDLDDMHKIYVDTIRAEKGGTGNLQSFPAIVLTPEVRERIKKAGVPIWSAAGMAIALGLDDEEQEFAEGGKVKGLKGLGEKIYDRFIEAGTRMMENSDNIEEFLKWRKERDRLWDQWKATKAASKDLEVEMAEGGKVDDLKKRVGTGFKSQWYGVDEDGNVRLFGGYGLEDVFFGDLADSFKKNILGQHVPKKYGPGIIDEIRSLTGLGTQVGEDADRRLELLREELNRREGLDEAQGFGENAAEALGVMLGQFPVPGASAKRAAKAGGSRLKRMLMAAPEAVVEWFSPTVQPSVKNYVAGSTVGGALGALASPEEEEDVPVAKKAEGGKVEATEPLNEMLALLKQRMQALGGTPAATVSVPNTEEPVMKKAKGGKVDTVARLLQRMRNLGLEHAIDDFKLDDGTYDLEDMREFIADHHEGVKETRATLKKAGITSNDPKTVARQVRQKIKGHTEQ